MRRGGVCVFVLVASNMRHTEDFHNQIDMSDIGQYSYYIVLLLYLDRIPSMIRNLLVCSQYFLYVYRIYIHIYILSVLTPNVRFHS